MSATKQSELFFGKDPVLGSQAVEYFAAQGARCLEQFLPLAGDGPAIDDQVEFRLRRLCAMIGPTAGGYLLRVIERAPWWRKRTAAASLSAVHKADGGLNGLQALLHHADIDVNRIAVEALGYMNAHELSFELVELASRFSDYTREKLGPYSIEALLRMVALADTEQSASSRLHDVERYLAAADYRSGPNWESGAYTTLQEFTSFAAGGLVRNWLVHEHLLFREWAARALGHIRIQRVARFLGDRLFDPGEDDSVRYAAAIALGQIGGEKACQVIQEALPLIERSTTLRKGILWAFSNLYYQCAALEAETRITQSLLAEPGEAHAQLIYALGVLKKESHTESMEADLETQDPFTRGVAALALAHLQGQEAVQRLLRAEREATEPLERLFVLTALTNAGAPGKADALYQEIGQTGFYRRLRYPWQREILYALATRTEVERASAWAELMRVNLQQCLDEMKAFVGAPPTPITSSPAHPVKPAVVNTPAPAPIGPNVPAEIRDSLERFRRDHPDPSKVAFIMMRFSTTKAHGAIVQAIKDTLSRHGIVGLRADDKEYNRYLFQNILTYIHGCSFGVAVFERIEADDFNPNVSLEAGYFLALGRPLCLLKDKTLKTLQTDLIGTLYRAFDPQDIQASIDRELSRWLGDNDLI